MPMRREPALKELDGTDSRLPVPPRHYCDQVLVVFVQPVALGTILDRRNLVKHPVTGSPA
jgi:hypothetical protein